MANIKEVLNFSKRLGSIWLRNAKNYAINKKTIISNVGEKDAVISSKPPIVLPPRSSTIVRDVSIESADSLVLVHVSKKVDLGGIILDKDWLLWNHVDPGSPMDVPLYMSPQYNVGQVCFDPYFVTAVSDMVDENRAIKYQVKVNLWFSPEKTNCGIHNKHTNPERMETHTQISGVGIMQKFTAKDVKTIYQDVVLGEGATHPTFASVNADGKFWYPWHQYYAETDCIWMSIEFHPLE